MNFSRMSLSKQQNKFHFTRVKTLKNIELRLDFALKSKFVLNEGLLYISKQKKRLAKILK